MSDNYDKHDDCDNRLYEIDCNNLGGSDETHVAKHFTKQEGCFACFTVPLKELWKGQRADEGTESLRGGSGLYRRDGVVEGKEGRSGTSRHIKKGGS